MRAIKRMAYVPTLKAPGRGIRPWLWLLFDCSFAILVFSLLLFYTTPSLPLHTHQHILTPSPVGALALPPSQSIPVP